MNTFIEIVKTELVKDVEGFTSVINMPVAAVRAYKEDRHGTEMWANRAAFTSATSLFRFRAIPNVQVTTSMIIVCNGGRYQILSVEDVKGRGMYIEVLADRITPSKRQPTG